MVQDCPSRSRLEQITHNAVTPMTHLFLKTKTILEEKESNDLSSMIFTFKLILYVLLLLFVEIIEN